jgi:hypothetical protein
VDKLKRGEGDNMLGDRLQDNISARAETRGFSEQQQAVRTPDACQTPHASSGHLSCRSMMMMMSFICSCRNKK